MRRAIIVAAFLLLAWPRFAYADAFDLYTNDLLAKIPRADGTARVKALTRDSRGGRTQVVADVNLESVAALLDDEDDENVGYGQIMVSMTRNSRRSR